MTVDCTCGVEGCRELSWPHGWDPIAAGDECMLGRHSDLRAFAFGDPDPVNVVVDAPGFDAPLLDTRHKVRVPFARWGSGYACQACSDGEEKPWRVA